MIFGVRGCHSGTWLQVVAESEWRESGEKIKDVEDRLTAGGLTPNRVKEKRKRIHCVGRWTGYSRRKANYLILKMSLV